MPRLGEDFAVSGPPDTRSGIPDDSSQPIRPYSGSSAGTAHAVALSMKQTTPLVSDVTLIPLAEAAGRPVACDVIGPPHAPIPSWPSGRDWLRDAFHRPAPVGDQFARVMVHDGWVIGLALAPRAQQLGRGLGRRHAWAAPGLGPKHGDVITVVVAADGSGSSTTPNAPATPAFRRMVERLERERRDLCTDGWVARVQRLEGPGVPLLLAEVRRVAPLQVPRFAALTAAQLAVCELAALGFSAREIAEQRGGTTETVRSHLRAAYRRLGVAARVELVPVIDEWERWAADLPGALERAWSTRAGAGSPAWSAPTSSPSHSLVP